MKSIVAGAAFAAIALACATPALAATTLYANEGDWGAAVSGFHTVNISNGVGVRRLGEGNVTVGYGDVLFHQDASISGNSPMFYLNGNSGATRGTLSSQQGALDNILVTLPEDTFAFSLNFGAWQYPHPGPTVNFLLSNGDSFTLPSVGGFTYDTRDFFGVTSTTAFHSVLVTSDEVVMNISNVAYGVPEPQTWSLMIVGFLGAGLALRRRRALAA